MIEYLPLLGLLMAIGAFAGVVAGLLGVGGGIILVPAFFYMFTHLGYDSPVIMQICLATSLATIVVTSARSIHSHNKRGAVSWEILRAWAPGIAVGAVVGVLIAGLLRTNTLMVIFGVLGVCIGLFLAFGRAEWRLGSAMPSGIRRIFMAPMVGFLSVLMGVGGGSFGVPLMTLYGQPIHRAVGTAAGFGALIAVPSVATFLMIGWDVPQKPPMTFGMVNLPTFLVVIAMTMLTTPLGVRLAHSLNPKPLRRVFAVFILIVAGNMLRRALF